MVISINVLVGCRYSLEIKRNGITFNLFLPCIAIYNLYVIRRISFII